MRDGRLTVELMPNSDHQLPDHARTPPNEEERESFSPPPSCSPPVGSHVVSQPLIALPATASHLETTDPRDCTRSDTVVGVGKEQGQVR